MRVARERNDKYEMVETSPVVNALYSLREYLLKHFAEYAYLVVVGLVCRR